MAQISDEEKAAKVANLRLVPKAPGFFKFIYNVLCNNKILRLNTATVELSEKVIMGAKKNNYYLWIKYADKSDSETLMNGCILKGFMEKAETQIQLLVPEFKEKMKFISNIKDEYVSLKIYDDCVVNEEHDLEAQLLKLKAGDKVKLTIQLKFVWGVENSYGVIWSVSKITT